MVIFIFFSVFGLFLCLFKNQNIYYNKNVLLKPLKVIVYIRIASKSTFEENEVQTDQKNYRTMLFMSKQVCLPNISSILQKVKIGPKTDIRPFCTKAFNYNMKPYIYQQAKTSVLSIGFSLSFGAMFSKTWQVHKIFTAAKTNKKMVRSNKISAP